MHQFLLELRCFLRDLFLLFSCPCKILRKRIPASLVETVHRLTTAVNLGNPLYSVRSLIRGNK